MPLIKIHTKFPYLKSDRLMRDNDHRGGQPVPRYPQAKRETETEPHGMSDDFSRALVTSGQRMTIAAVSKRCLNPAVQQAGDEEYGSRPACCFVKFKQLPASAARRMRKSGSPDYSCTNMRWAFVNLSRSHLYR